MRCLVVVIVAVLLAGSVDAQPRFAVQEPPAPAVRDNAQRARDLRRDQDRPRQAHEAWPLACITTRMLSVPFDRFRFT